MRIDKIASVPSAFFRPARRFPNARSAFKGFLEAMPGRPGLVLLPGYIGWSAREGSGVFDPIEELGLRYEFYRMDARLMIDLEDLRARLESGDVRLVVLIHYFGYPDPHYSEAVELARAHGALVLEDEAHAMFSDIVGGSCGRLGDAALFSLHKLLPLKRGGLLTCNRGDSWLSGLPDDTAVSFPWDYDLYAIARARRANAAALSKLLAPLAGDVDALRPDLPDGVVPQTYPVLIRRVSRDALYEAMNAAGFGVVSLYHTMIKALSRSRHQDAYALSAAIMNLPVHQDIEYSGLEALTARLRDCLRTLPAAQG